MQRDTYLLVCHLSIYLSFWLSFYLSTIDPSLYVKEGKYSNTLHIDLIKCVPLCVEEVCRNHPQFVSQIYADSDKFEINAA